jgi:hypothetical protein
VGGAGIQRFRHAPVESALTFSNYATGATPESRRLLNCVELLHDFLYNHYPQDYFSWIFSSPKPGNKSIIFLKKVHSWLALHLF